jgi:hypothetical protein
VLFVNQTEVLNNVATVLADANIALAASSADARITGDPTNATE